MDATGVPRARLRNPTVGHAGSIGRHLPLRVAAEFVRFLPAGNGVAEVAFTLTNSGENPLVIPVSPNPRDLEPSDPKASYRLKNINLYITSDRRQESVLAGGARLYGSEAFPSTLVMLASQKSLRILARVTLPPVLADHSSEAVFVAHAVLNDQTMGMVGGQISEDTKEIGSAVSPEYGSQIPSKKPE